MRAVDTNVVIRLITRDDPKQVAAAEAFVARGAWVPHLVVAEAMWVLGSVYNRGPQEIATAVEMLLNHQQLTIQDSETVAAAAATLRKQPRLGFSDCLVVEIARKSGHTPVGTFDRDLSRLADVEKLARRRRSRVLSPFLS